MTRDKQFRGAREEDLVAHTGLEPVISALRGQRVNQLHQCALMDLDYRCAPSRLASGGRLRHGPDLYNATHFRQPSLINKWSRRISPCSVRGAQAQGSRLGLEIVSYLRGWLAALNSFATTVASSSKALTCPERYRERLLARRKRSRTGGAPRDITPICPQ